MTQEKKNKNLLISLALLIAATATTYFLIQADNRTVVDKSVFKVADLNEVDRVVLESRKGRLELKYNGAQWKVNDEYPADLNMIKVLFATLEQAEPKRPVAASVNDSLAATLKNEGVHVTLYAGGTASDSFYAGGNNAKTQAYFMNPEDEQVYLVTIPGYRVYVSGVFELDPGGFRNKYVFSFNWRNFKSLTVNFPGHEKEGFQVAMDKDYFSIVGVSAVDTAKLNTFLDQISLLTIDEYISNQKMADSLSRQVPIMEVTIDDIANRKYELKLFTPFDRTHQPGLIGSQGAYFNPERIRPILRPKSFFIKQ